MVESAAVSAKHMAEFQKNLGKGNGGLTSEEIYRELGEVRVGETKSGSGKDQTEAGGFPQAWGGNLRDGGVEKLSEIYRRDAGCGKIILYKPKNSWYSIKVLL